MSLASDRLHHRTLAATADAAAIIQLAAKIEIIAKHINAEGYCATACVIGDAAKEIRERAEKALYAAADLNRRILETTK